MNPKELDQIKGYSRLIVHELHKNIFDDTVFDKLKSVLLLAEEFECYLMQLEIQQKERGSNVVRLKIA